jgi:hypothetical protein
MLREMQKAIDPSPGIHWSVSHWPEIVKGLRDSSRRRVSQHHRLQTLIAHYEDFS